MIKKEFIFSLLILLSVASLGSFIVYAEQSERAELFNNLFGSSGAKIIYSQRQFDQDQGGFSVNMFSLSGDKFLKLDSNAENQKISLSPDRTLLAVSFQDHNHTVYTYITDLQGEIFVPPHLGNFKSWTPDSDKVLLYLSIEATGESRRIYFLDIHGNYTRSNLPDGVFSADISKYGDIVYSTTDSRTDNSAIYVQHSNGNTTLAVPYENKILSWPRWSPEGDLIAYIKFDLQGTANAELWVTRADGSERIRVSNIEWGYHPVWSPDGTKITFAGNNAIWEYEIQTKVLQSVADIGKFVQHPNYSADGRTIVFSDGKQIWATRGGNVYEMTTGEGIKSYPILP